ncbi:MAG: decarboxylating 6-phosphogluconate dehydrogenase [Gammaproteobacteria bacterium]|nr:decarboxylating 6-phosphogluconate dehydrogenase [Gammaproteobacteria bacterium]MDH4310135.1 decarboxylating 6-phosphogluconate dehydrogenase [Gammaproteobacteria bacterium]MDH5272569.1 decarboxylating 6-phosphogluconate dehydrogenase [Gammaproteobacteria bacterium]
MEANTMNLTLGMIGLGRMGGNMSRRLARAGHTLVAWDRSAEARAAMADERRVTPADTLEALVARLPSPRLLWLMLPAGAPTDQTLLRLVPLLSQGDLVIDGANAMYKDSQRHATELGAHGIRFVDAGVSGGVWGLENGYGLMVGGDAAAVRMIEPVLRALAPAADRGWVHCGPAGAGHFTKMVHNGIEYGMMQSYAEGLALLRAKSEFALDLPQITEAWRHGTVIRSWLLDLTAEFLAHDPTLESTAPFVADSGEGRWTAIESIELGVPTPVMTLSLMARFASQGKGDFTNRLLARMRQAFGGHAVQAK